MKHAALAAAACVALAACTPQAVKNSAPPIKTLQNQKQPSPDKLPIIQSEAVAPDPQKALENYRKLLELKADTDTRLEAQKRIADIAIDFYAATCLLSRVSQAIEEKGQDKCELELAICEAFFSRANRRIRGNFKAIDRNDDDAMKLIAAKAYELGSYPWDTI